MSKFYLEVPTLQRKEDALEYLNEHIIQNAKINGTGGLNRCSKGMSYEEWLDDVTKMPDSNYSEALGLVPTYTYFLIRKEDNRIVGMVNLRYNLNEMMAKYAGHIGYGIRPSERQKGYAKIQLYLILQKALELGLTNVMISCDASNTASDCTIKALDGKFERNDFMHDVLINIYWINVKEVLEKYKNVYEMYID